MKADLIKAMIDVDPQGCKWRWRMEYADGCIKTGSGPEDLGFAPGDDAMKDALVALCAEKGCEIDRGSIVTGKCYFEAQDPKQPPPPPPPREPQAVWNRPDGK